MLLAGNLKADEGNRALRASGDQINQTDQALCLVRWGLTTDYYCYSLFLSLYHLCFYILLILSREKR